MSTAGKQPAWPGKIHLKGWRGRGAQRQGFRLLLLTSDEFWLCEGL